MVAVAQTGSHTSYHKFWLQKIKEQLMTTASMDTLTITGYQYGNHNQFIGVYEFPNNLDKEEIHMPPNTVLIKPPDAPQGYEAIWGNGQWTLNVEDTSHLIKHKPMDSI